MNNYTKISFIYGLSSSTNDKLIRYIGFSTNPHRRLHEHLDKSRYETTKVYSWIKSQKEKGNKILYTILGCFPEEIIGKKETEFILLYKSFGANLLNHNNGGLGGHSPDAETRAKLSKAQMGNQKGKGKKRTVEQIEKIRNFNTGRPKNKRQLEAFKKVRERIWSNPELVKEMIRKSSEARKGKAQPNRSLTEEQVCYIFKLQNEGKGFKEIQNITKYSETKLNNLLYNKNRYTDFKIKNNLKLIYQRRRK